PPLPDALERRTGRESAAGWLPRFCGLLPPVLLLLVMEPNRWLERWPVAVGTLVAGGLAALWIWYRRRFLFAGDPTKIEYFDNWMLRLFFIGGAVVAVYGSLSPAHLQWVRLVGPAAAWLGS